MNRLAFWTGAFLALAGCTTSSTTPDEAPPAPRVSIPTTAPPPPTTAAPTTTTTTSPAPTTTVVPTTRRGEQQAARARRVPPPGRAAPSASLAAIAECESGGDYQAVSASGRYRGAYQFDAQTHRSVGGDGNAADDSPAEQDAAAERLMARRGTQPWPVCGR